MHRSSAFGLLLSLACLSSASAGLRGRVRTTISPPDPQTIQSPMPPVVSRNGTILPPVNTTYYFNQLVDHNNPSRGTFQQRFWLSAQFYQKGGPIILLTPGENNADGYYQRLGNTTMLGLIAQQQNGTTVILEHRFFGLSNPLPDLTVKSLQLLTLQQAADDLVYFAKTVNLPMHNGNQVSPDKAPWILVGASYAGALTAWTMVSNPGVFFAGYASSAVVQALVNFWQYFEPIREYMPANCSADVQAVTAHIDEVFTGSNTTAIQAIKTLFNMGDLTHLDDMTEALLLNVEEWQSLNVASQGGEFYKFCDALEVKNGVQAPASGWGLDYALPAWGSYWRDYYYDLHCGDQDVESCLGSYDPTSSIYTNTSIDNSQRSWMWLLCNDVGWFQVGAPSGTPTLVSRLITPAYAERQCQFYFPGAFTNTSMPKANDTNAQYKGWNVHVDRLFFATGKRDPWRDVTVSAEGRQVVSTSLQPIAISDGFHASDMNAVSAIDPTVAAVQQQGLASIKQWLSTWKPTASH